jgi:hypothetical protein
MFNKKLSAGYDDILECLVKKYIKHIEKPLVHMHNMSLSSGIFPTRFKIAEVLGL